MAKIKRYKNIYFSSRQRRRSVLKPVLLCLAAALLIFVGYSVTGPAIRFFKGETASRRSASASAPPQVSKKAASSKKSSAAGPTSSETASALRGIYLPNSFLSNVSALNGAVAGAKSAGLNLAVVDVKDVDGLIRYRSALPAATNAGLVAAGAADPAAAANAIRAAGLTAGARMSCFADNAASNVMRSAAVLYSANGTARWMDQKNQFWLNPYSPAARQYLIDLAKELVSKGFTCIIFDDVRFPTNSGKAYFAGQNGTRAQALAAFLTTARQQINAAGGKLVVHFDASTSIGAGTADTGLNQNFYALAADYASPEFRPSLLGAPVSVAGRTLTAPDADPVGTVSALAQYAKTQLPAGGHLMPYIQCDSGSARAYTAADVSGQLAALRKAGFASYLLISSGGHYSLNGVATR